MSYSQEIINEALRKNDKSLLVKMINDGVDVNSMVIPHHTDILLLSILYGSHQFFKRILESGFVCNPTNGFLYLHHAIRSHDVYFVDLIMANYKDNNYSINEKYQNGDNCLHVAAREFGIPLSIFKHLTDAGISWIEQNKKGRTPLHLILNKGKDLPEELFTLFINNKDILSVKDKDGVTPLDLITELKKNAEWSSNNQQFLSFLSI